MVMQNTDMTYLDEYGVDSIRVTCLDEDLEMVALVAEAGWESEPSSFHGTLGVADPRAFWDACTPLFEERVGAERLSKLSFETDGQLRFACEVEEPLPDGWTGFTQLVFMAAHEREELGLILKADSELARILRCLFPLPLPEYGLNYA